MGGWRHHSDAEAQKNSSKTWAPSCAYTCTKFQKGTRQPIHLFQRGWNSLTGATIVTSFRFKPWTFTPQRLHLPSVSPAPYFHAPMVATDKTTLVRTYILGNESLRFTFKQSCLTRRFTEFKNNYHNHFEWLSPELLHKTSFDALDCTCITLIPSPLDSHRFN